MLSLSIDRIEHYLRNWLAFGFFVYLGAFFVFPSANYFIFSISIALPAIILCIASRFKCVPDKRIVLVCVVFLGYLSLSVLWGSGKPLKGIVCTLCILLLMISVDNVSQKFSENAVLKFIIIMGLITAASYSFYIVAMFISGHDVTAYFKLRLSFQEIGGWGSKHIIDSTVIAGLPIIASWFFFSGKKWDIKLALIITIVLCLILMSITKSRGPILSAAIILLFISLFRRKKSDLTLFLFLVFIGGIFLFFMYTDYFMTFKYFDDIIVTRIQSESHRSLLWREAWGMFMDHWLFGQGYETPAGIMVEGEKMSHAHNTYIEILRMSGIIGGILFVFMFCSIVRFSYINSKNIFFLFWLFFGLMWMFVDDGFPLKSPKEMGFFIFWIPLFLFYFQRKRSDKSEQLSENGAVLIKRPNVETGFVEKNEAK